ncbi:MAG: ATP-binding protein [Phycisphaerae bacterium]
MSLRAKCALLLVAFELTLAATLMLTVRSISSYFEDAARAFAVSRAGMTNVSLLRTLVRKELAHLQDNSTSSMDAAERERLAHEIETLAETLEHDQLAPIGPDEWVEMRRLVAARATGRDTSGFDPATYLALDDYLETIESRMLTHVRASIGNTFSTQQTAILILSANMVVAAALGILGMFLVRRWVLLPIQDLKTTTDELGKGRLDHRVQIRSGDEFGRLATAINKMSADLARIEQQMILRERAAAMGELVSYIAHNIRNPLAGIRSLADSCRRQSSENQALRDTQDGIVAAVEALQRWLRELEHTCSPLDIHPQPVHIRDLIDNILTVFRPMSQRRSIGLERSIADDFERVDVDERQFEQAVAAIVANAIEAVGDDGRVMIRTDRDKDGMQWSLTITDTGPGIPKEIRHRILDPAFSTKRSGHGLGLAMARKVAELHGGQLSFENPAGGGTVFRFTMPTRPDAKITHG